MPGAGIELLWKDTSSGGITHFRGLGGQTTHLQNCLARVYIRVINSVEGMCIRFI